MKKYIFSLVSVLALALVMVSCEKSDFTRHDWNPSEEEENPNPNPGGGDKPVVEIPMKVGCFVVPQNTDGVTYQVVVSKDAIGDPFVYVMQLKANEAPIVLMASEDAAYDAEDGLLAAASQTSYFGDGQNDNPSQAANVYVTYDDEDQSNAIIRLEINGENLFNVEAQYSQSAVDALSPMLGVTWTDLNENTQVVFMPNGTVYYVAPGSEDVVSGKCEFKNGVLSGSAGEHHFIAKYNADLALTFKVGDNEPILLLPTNTATPSQGGGGDDNDWKTFEAQYTDGLFFKPGTGAKVEFRMNKKGECEFAPFISSSEPFRFTVDNENLVHYEVQKTGYIHKQDGKEYGEVVVVGGSNLPADKGGTENDGSFDGKGTFTFNFCWMIPEAKAGFGVIPATLTILKAKSAAAPLMTTAVPHFELQKHLLFQ